MRGKLAALILIALLLCSASGCVDANYHLTVNIDGSGDIDLKVVFSADTMNLFQSLGVDPLATLAGDLEQEGYTVTPYQDDITAGIRARKHVQMISGESLDFAPVAVQLQAAAALDHDLLKIERSLFRTNYIVETEVDPAGFTGTPQLSGVEAYILKQVNYMFVLTLPIAPREHNADSSEDQGKTLLWQLEPGQANLIKFEVSHWNPAGLAFLALIALIAAAVLVVLIRRSKGRQN